MFIPLSFTNDMSAQSYGFEVFGNYSLSRQWQLHGSYSFLRTVLDAQPDVTHLADEGSSPRHQFFAQVSWEPDCRWQCDLFWRYVDNLPTLGIPSYNALGARLAYQFSNQLEFAAVAQHLLDSSHAEFPDDPNIGLISSQVQPEVYGVLTWRY